MSIFFNVLADFGKAFAYLCKNAWHVSHRFSLHIASETLVQLLSFYTHLSNAAMLHSGGSCVECWLSNSGLLHAHGSCVECWLSNATQSVNRGIIRTLALWPSPNFLPSPLGHSCIPITTIIQRGVNCCKTRLFRCYGMTWVQKYFSQWMREIMSLVEGSSKCINYSNSNNNDGGHDL